MWPARAQETADSLSAKLNEIALTDSEAAMLTAILEAAAGAEVEGFASSLGAAPQAASLRLGDRQVNRLDRFVRRLLDHFALRVKQPDRGDRHQVGVTDLFDPLDPIVFLLSLPVGEINELGSGCSTPRRGGPPNLTELSPAKKLLQSIAGGELKTSFEHLFTDGER